jgi:arylsulfatase A-like enzyme
MISTIPSEEPQWWKNKKEWFTHWTAYLDTIISKVSGIEDPYFLWIFIMDPHQPYLVPREFRRETNAMKMYYSNAFFRFQMGNHIPSHVAKWMRQTYRDTVRSADAFVRDLHQELGDSNPALVVHADHGEALGDHGTWRHEYRLFEENINVPLLIHGINSSETVSSPVSLISLPEMIEEIGDKGTLSHKKFAKTAFLSTAESTELASARGDAFDYIPHEWAVRGSRFKLIKSSNDVELFDLDSDPNERRDVSDEYPDVVDCMSDIGELMLEQPEEKNRIHKAVRRVNFDGY